MTHMLESGVMTQHPVLDILFLAIVALFVPIGFARGVVREVFVTAAVLAGATFATSWARPWGGDLADQTVIRVDLARFLVSTSMLVDSMVVFGYWAASVASPARPGFAARCAGAVLAAINGALVLAFLLRDVERFLADEGTRRSLAESRVASILLRDFGWAVAGSACVMFVTILVGTFIGNRAERVSPRPPARTEPGVSGRRHRLRWGRDDGKVEPSSRGFDAATERYRADTPHHADTMPIAPVNPSAWSHDRPYTGAGAGEWVDISTASPGTITTTETQRCPGCGERTVFLDAFCPRCGRSLGK